MKKIFVTVMLLIALMFVGKMSLHLYGIVQFVASTAEANISNSKVVAEAGDYKETHPC
ncbi:MAG: hypothetical protein HZA06_07445 [Nitrospirae bacterium]|nr:hypothetical protein [Nitrospirota bacterium]